MAGQLPQLKRRKFLELPDAGLAALDHVNVIPESGLQRGDGGGAQFLAVHRLGEGEEGEYIRVAVDDQSREGVGFTEDQAARIAAA